MGNCWSDCLGHSRDLRRGGKRKGKSLVMRRLADVDKDGEPQLHPYERRNRG